MNLQFSLIFFFLLSTIQTVLNFCSLDEWNHLRQQRGGVHAASFAKRCLRSRNLYCYCTTLSSLHYTLTAPDNGLICENNEGKIERDREMLGKEVFFYFKSIFSLSLSLSLSLSISCVTTASSHERECRKINFCQIRDHHRCAAIESAIQEKNSTKNYIWRRTSWCFWKAGE
jgi:hypothetical protein